MISEGNEVRPYLLSDLLRTLYKYYWKLGTYIFISQTSYKESRRGLSLHTETFCFIDIVLVPKCDWKFLLQHFLLYTVSSFDVTFSVLLRYFFNILSHKQFYKHQSILISLVSHTYYTRRILQLYRLHWNVASCSIPSHPNYFQISGSDPRLSKTWSISNILRIHRLHTYQKRVDTLFFSTHRNTMLFLKYF